MSDVTGNDTLTFLGDVVDLDVFDKAVLGIQVTGTWTATLTWTGSIDGVNFFSVFPLLSTTASIAANTQTWFNVNGLTRFRLSATAYTSGTAVVNYVANAAAFSGGQNPITAGGSLIPGTFSTNLGKAEDAVHASGDTGVAVWAVRNDTGVTSPASGDGDYSYIAVDAMGSPRVTAGKSGVTTSAHTVFRLAAAGTTNATSIKGTPGNVYAMSLCNTSAAIKYVKFYNKATAPTVGTDTPVLVIGVPATSTVFPMLNLVPIPFSTGVAMATTALGTDADATAVTANDLMITVYYA